MMKKNESDKEKDVEDRNTTNKKDTKLNERRNIVVSNLTVDDGWTELKYKKPTPIKRLADSIHKGFLKIF